MPIVYRSSKTLLQLLLLSCFGVLFVLSNTNAYAQYPWQQGTGGSSYIGPSEYAPAPNPPSVSYGVTNSDYSTTTTNTYSTGFKSTQLQNYRVLEAFEQKDAKLRTEFQKKNMQYPPREVYLRSFKREGIVEVWVLDGYSGQYKKFKDYTVCASSGRLGPKQRQGDKQVPEGFYRISEFNPSSTYYLSMKVNYPNSVDRIRSTASRLGGDIYIHGDCVTIGCLPLTDHKMMEIYWLSVLAKDGGQGQIPVHIFPYKFDNFNHDAEARSDNPHLHRFWDNLAEGYRFFQNYGRPPEVTENMNGTYSFR